jgi:hypothetical protein
MMPLKRLPTTAAAFLSALVASLAAAVAHAEAATPGQAVTDTTLLAMVNDRPITVRTFRVSYFATPTNIRPLPDSLGRIEYLRTLVTKEVLGLTALGLDLPLDFSDRAVLREHREVTLANTLYQRLVEDSVRVTEAELQAAHAHFGYDQRVREMRFQDRVTAERVRRGLIAGKTTWDEAAGRHALSATEPVWLRRRDVSMLVALTVFPLNPGQLSEVIADGDGVHLYQVLERRSFAPPAYSGLRRYLWIQLQSAKALPYAERLNDMMRREMAVAYDTTYIRFVASQMGDTRGVKPGVEGPVVEVTPKLPDFSTADLERALVRWNDGQLTLGELLPAYTAGSPFFRGNLDTFESMRAQIDGMIFGPTMARVAERLGFENDSLAEAVLKRKLESILVERLYRDSVESKVRPSDDEVRAFYDQNRQYFQSHGTARWAGIPRPTRDEALAVLDRLRAGEDPAVILRVDSLAGRPLGSIQDRDQDGHGPYHETLFGELRPGESTVIGPHGDGSYAVVKLISREPSLPLPFDEVRAEVTEAVRAVQSEALLQQLVGRHSRTMKIIFRPELLMAVSLTDPADEITLD